MSIPLPEPVRQFFSIFPLYTHPPNLPPRAKTLTSPTLWILPPKNAEDTTLSSDVECLKWQAYLALRGLNEIAVRWDIAPEGGVDGRLPTLQLPNGELLGAQKIPAWADEVQHKLDAHDEWEGYKDEEAKDESRAWVALLEGVVHAALVVCEPQPSLFTSLFYPHTGANLPTLLHPPAAPQSGLSTIFPTFGTNVPTSTIIFRYREAIASLSERLGTDKWFLGSAEPTPLDALAFAYLYCALESTEEIKREVLRRVNLVAWEKKVRAIVQNNVSKQ